MPETPILNMLLGAALVAIGVIAAAFADRVRGLHARREIARRSPSAPAVLPSFESVDPLVRPARPPRPEVKVQAGTARQPDEGARDVVHALVGAGYKKSIAAEATWACSLAERVTVEGWTRAALRRCGRGM